MGRTRVYQRTTDYVPRDERVLTVRAVHRTEPDVGKLTEAFIRLALQRVTDARAAREEKAPPSSLKPGTHR
ncbi:hypothetical protein GCM10022198_19190 [Klugiella xanthotipulae]|uniref:Uncharacterized protein n=1 Tax=Klugiella xanthotipulae TaxID=244735 RepID=A0A543HS68_9MICO|nr:hypothetical protein [Klugiella xanthotipulae]TQM61119.1 hypothetical protein FB466_2050 [Klugiella xanthotipulae]